MHDSINDVNIDVTNLDNTSFAYLMTDLRGGYNYTFTVSILKGSAVWLVVAANNMYILMSVTSCIRNSSHLAMQTHLYGQ